MEERKWLADNSLEMAAANADAVSRFGETMEERVNKKLEIVEILVQDEIARFTQDNVKPTN